MKHTLENFFISTLGALILGTLILLFLFRAKQCHDVKESSKERLELKCLETAWRQGYHAAFGNVILDNYDSLEVQIDRDIELILKTYK